MASEVAATSPNVAPSLSDGSGWRRAIIIGESSFWYTLQGRLLTFKWGGKGRRVKEAGPSNCRCPLEQIVT